MTEYWYCLVHETVVTSGEGCPSRDRLGPYDSHDEASRALEIAAKRTEAWDNDPKWNDDVDPGAGE